MGNDGARIRVAHRDWWHLGASDAFDDVSHQFGVGSSMLPLPGRKVRTAAALCRITMTCGAFFDKKTSTASGVSMLRAKRSGGGKDQKGESSDAHLLIFNYS
jgi:hypothetical protein